MCKKSFFWILAYEKQLRGDGSSFLLDSYSKAILKNNITSQTPETEPSFWTQSSLTTGEKNLSKPFITILCKLTKSLLNLYFTRILWNYQENSGKRLYNTASGICNLQCKASLPTKLAKTKLVGSTTH